MNKREIFKYNQDDILEILLEYLGEETEFDTYQSSAILLGTPGKDLRLVAVIGDIDDMEINQVDLAKVDNEMDYNGTHTEIDGKFLIENKDLK